MEKKDSFGFFVLLHWKGLSFLELDVYAMTVGPLDYFALLDARCGHRLRPEVDRLIISEVEVSPLQA